MKNTTVVQKVPEYVGVEIGDYKINGDLNVTGNITVTGQVTGNITNGSASSVIDIPRKKLYDSGWVTTTLGGNTDFTHNLGGIAVIYNIFAADDSSGTNPTAMLNGRGEPGGTSYSSFVSRLNSTVLSIYTASYMAYSRVANKWYAGGTDYARLIIYQVDPDF